MASDFAFLQPISTEAIFGKNFLTKKWKQEPVELVFHSMGCLQTTQAITDIRLYPPVRHVTSSTKPKVHNVLHCRHKSIASQPHVRLFHQRWLGCWQSMWHASSYRQRWGLELAQCAAPLILVLVLYILRAQLSLRVSLARCGPVLQVEPLAPAIYYPHRRLSPHPDAPNPGVMAYQFKKRYTGKPSCTCPRI